MLPKGEEIRWVSRRRQCEREEIEVGIMALGKSAELSWEGPFLGVGIQHLGPRPWKPRKRKKLFSTSWGDKYYQGCRQGSADSHWGCSLTSVNFKAWRSIRRDTWRQVWWRYFTIYYKMLHPYSLGILELKTHSKAHHPPQACYKEHHAHTATEAFRRAFSRESAQPQGDIEYWPTNIPSVGYPKITN